MVHLSGGQWLVVDSCRNRESGRPAALDYLDRIGVRPAQSVVLIVASHWHDDHIGGLAEILEAAPDAEFACSEALHSRHFYLLASGDAQVPMSGNSGLREFTRILKYFLEVGIGPARSRGPTYWSTAHQTLRSAPASVIALSPSASSITTAARAFGSFLKLGKAKRQTPSDIDANRTSVALWIEIEDIRLLLGADLEDTANPTEGWKAIVSAHQRPLGLASVFKVPHHGSPNAHNEDVWTQMVGPNAHALLTSFVMSQNPRPNEADQSRICRRTKRAYLTSPSSGFSPKRRSSTVERTMAAPVRSRRARVGPLGHVRLRRTIGSPNWSVEFDGPAFKMCAKNASRPRSPRKPGPRSSRKSPTRSRRKSPTRSRRKSPTRSRRK